MDWLNRDWRSIFINSQGTVDKKLTLDLKILIDFPGPSFIKNMIEWICLFSRRFIKKKFLFDLFLFSRWNKYLYFCVLSTKFNPDWIFVWAHFFKSSISILTFHNFCSRNAIYNISLHDLVEITDQVCHILIFQLHATVFFLSFSFESFPRSSFCENFLTFRK